MKIRFRFLVLLTLAATVVLAAGCASPEDDNLLVRAGFDAIRANTTTQLDIIKKMNPDEILVLHKNGRTFYAFPDPVRSQIFVGNEADYSRYRKLRAAQNSRVQEANCPWWRTRAARSSAPGAIGRAGMPSQRRPASS